MSDLPTPCTRCGGPRNWGEVTYIKSGACLPCASEELADAERYRWLRDTLHSAKAGGGVDVNQVRQYYEEPKPGEEVRLYWYSESPVGCWVSEAATLDEAIDNARSSKRINPAPSGDTP